MKVSELVSDPTLQIALGVRGDLDRSIAWVHAIDRYPASEFMSGGEVALTSGQWWPTVDAETFVADLASAGVAALGFGLTSRVNELPSHLLAACETRGLTFFVVPREVRFSDVIRAFVSFERRRLERPLRAHLDFHASFVEGLRADPSIEGMLTATSRGISMPVALAADGRVIGADTVEGMFPIALESIALGEGTLYLAEDPDMLDDRQRAVLAVATPFVAIELERIRSVRRTIDNYTRELFTWLRAGSQDQTSINARLDSLGIQARSQMSIVALSGRDRDIVLAAVRRVHGAAVAARFDDEVLVCLAEMDDDEVSAFIAQMPPGTSAGIGSLGPADHLRLSLIQAEHALQLARGMAPGSIVAASDLSSPSSILRSAPGELITEAATALLAPLHEYDAARNGQLVRTLRVFLDTGGRWSVAANELFVHPNTLRHRIQTIEGLTGRDLDKTRDRTDFDIALSFEPDPES